MKAPLALTRPDPMDHASRFAAAGSVEWVADHSADRWPRRVDDHTWTLDQDRTA